MSTGKRVFAGCMLLPVVLIGACCGKMSFDAAMYDLPGEVLKSTVRPTQSLAAAFQVAEALDAYVQPRFEILRDKNFGALRIVYRRHAGILQLKVDTPREKELIANVDAANRDYAICLLHCAPRPNYGADAVTPELELLYYNRQQVAEAADFRLYDSNGTQEIAAKNHLDLKAIENRAVAALPRLMAGQEQRIAGSSWDILMRPVRAGEQACLNCHTNAKPAATLGVMIYAVRKARRNETASLGLR